MGSLKSSIGVKLRLVKSMPLSCGLFSFVKELVDHVCQLRVRPICSKYFFTEALETELVTRAFSIWSTPAKSKKAYASLRIGKSLLRSVQK